MRPTIEDVRAQGQKTANDRNSGIRRMAIESSAGLLWGVAGGEDAGGNIERDTVEVFGVAGVTSRPAGDAEMIVVTVGLRGGHTVGIAVRDPSMSAAGDLEADEVAIQTTKTFVKITAEGEVLIGRPDSTFERVATESHVHGPGDYANSGGPLTPGTVSGHALRNPGTTPLETDRLGLGLTADLKAGT
jgi:hypothetical protein